MPPRQRLNLQDVPNFVYHFTAICRVRHITFRELARRTGIGVSELSRYVGGLAPTRPMIARIAAALDVPVSALTAPRPKASMRKSPREVA